MKSAVDAFQSCQSKPAGVSQVIGNCSSESAVSKPCTQQSVASPPLEHGNNSTNSKAEGGEDLY
eukprot:COSAG02_NODE_51825_length_311_cov_1.433962_1_plen_63_part_01